MALPVSGPISIQDLVTEFTFDLPGPVPLSQFYRLGRWVPDRTRNAGIPTSGPISLQDFYNATGRWEWQFDGNMNGNLGFTSDTQITNSYYDRVAFFLDFDITELAAATQVEGIDIFSKVQGVSKTPTFGSFFVTSMTLYQGNNPGGIEYPSSGYSTTISGGAARLTFTPPMELGSTGGGRTRLTLAGTLDFNQ